MREGFIYKPKAENEPDWYEYFIITKNDDDEVVALWDSLFETYNRVQKLTKSEAEAALKDIIENGFE